MNKSGAYDLMEREYVNCPPGQEDQFTITAIAERYGRAKSSVARMSRLKGWKEKRAKAQAMLTGVVSELDTDTYAHRLHDIHGKFVDAAEKSLEAYTRAVENGDITPSAGDVAKMVTLVRDIVSKPGGGSEGETDHGGIQISESLGRELLGSIESLARERLERGSAAGAAEPKLVGSGEGRRIQVR